MSGAPGSAAGAVGPESLTARQELRRRRQEIVAEAEPLRRRLAELDHRIAQYDHIQAVMDAASRASTGSDHETIQDGALRVLSGAPAGLHVNDILVRMQATRPALTRTSLAPQLSRLKRDGRVRQLPRAVWALPGAAPLPLRADRPRAGSIHPDGGDDGLR